MFATQNPVEHEGTYPLPEAQLDRFLFKVQVGYPSAEEEDAVLARVERRRRHERAVGGAAAAAARPRQHIAGGARDRGARARRRQGARLHRAI